MKIIINTTSMVPIYEQVMDQIKNEIMEGTLTGGDLLPSVRGLSKELKISALTVKKAYDSLEAEGFVNTVHGKGTYVSFSGSEAMQEERLKDIEMLMDFAVQKGRAYGLSDDELREVLEIVLEDN